MVRLGSDVAASADVAHVLDKMRWPEADPAFDGNERMRENSLVLLEGQRCQAAAIRLMKELKRTNLTPARSKAVVRLLEEVARSRRSHCAAPAS